MHKMLQYASHLKIGCNSN